MTERQSPVGEFCYFRKGDYVFFFVCVCCLKFCVCFEFWGFLSRGSVSVWCFSLELKQELGFVCVSFGECWREIEKGEVRVE